jgi:hypothetical protein
MKKPMKNILISAAVGREHRSKLAIDKIDED